MIPGSCPDFHDLDHWPPSALDVALQQWWHELPSPRPQHLAIAFSGGADSTALLLGTLRLFCVTPLLPAAGQPPNITALHVHHGLQSCADAFEQHSQTLCLALQHAPALAGCRLRYQAIPVQVHLNRGDSIEARAREARYHALTQVARTIGADLVLLGHHADDQAESVLLALSRGAGVAGLAGMADRFDRQGMRYARPLLQTTRQTIEDWLRLHQVPWIEDPSNTDLRFTRNRLRHAILPVLETHLPGFSVRLGRSARLAAQADHLLQELAQLDLLQTGNPPHIAQLQSLSPSRQANVLRHWLKQTHGAIGSESQVRALLKLIAACRTRAHQIHVKVGQGHVVRDGATLCWKPLSFQEPVQSP